MPDTERLDFLEQTGADIGRMLGPTPTWFCNTPTWFCNIWSPVHQQVIVSAHGDSLRDTLDAAMVKWNAWKQERGGGRLADLMAQDHRPILRWRVFHGPTLILAFPGSLAKTEEQAKEFAKAQLRNWHDRFTVQAVR